MKATTFLVLIATTLGACDRGASPPADRSGVATERAATASAPFMIGGKVGASGGAPQFSGAGVASVTADAVSPESPPSSSDPLQNVNAGSAAPTMVIRTGQAFIEVDKVDPAILKIRQLAAQVGGYITNSSISGGRDQIRQATFELKIPAPKYDQATGLLSTIGKVETVSSTAQDVGEEFVDVTARVTNSRRLEERLISLLANRTGKLDEVLRVERELARVREEIERYEGRLRYLSARVAMSTLTITVHEPAPILGNSPGENPIAAALRRAWKNFIAVVAGSIAALGVLIPLALLGLAGWLAYKRWKRP
ncbi:MAG TPA: DUF4349 domain-containing protein [Gemmatimonadaceae bacterium]|nr:DUF4349 domain-containing protein [Gemmatimonadaceae bacterium]